MPRKPLPATKQPLALTQDEQADVDWAKRMSKQFTKGTVTSTQNGAKQRAINNNAKQFMKDALTGGY